MAIKNEQQVSLIKEIKKEYKSIKKFCEEEHYNYNTLLQQSKGYSRMTVVRFKEIERVLEGKRNRG